METLPFQLLLGTNRTRVFALAAKSRDEEPLGEPKSLQFAPALVEYCQLPLVLSTPVSLASKIAVAIGVEFE